MSFRSVRKVADADFPTRWGHFRILGFEGLTDGTDPNRKPVENAVALTMGDLHAKDASGNPIAPIIRIHSQCLTGDAFHSLRCDCHDQLHLALSLIAQEGAGILLYEQEEGRGIGLMAKLRAYELQDQGLDTIEANEQLGFRADYRGFELPAEILKALNIPAVRLITNNPEKVAALESAGIRVTERVSAAIPSEPTFERYLQTKHEKMGHLVG
ncbi:GTP cyclohydrolase II [Granulicella paludicola]|jgi:GTP cyclohydrolase II|uniref:GTP cyclohydrolase II n=1 Tax=Granulicella paludicola TaxID=474951 RepID=UPI0021E0D990|nr:GTP cyclohydrolase II [Granulicella paludicola]